jgi:hypothetical protein
VNYKWLIITLILGACSSSESYKQEIQLTKDPLVNHTLDNNDNFSPDGKWLVYDTRTGVGGIGGSPSVERVNVETGENQVLFGVKDNRDWGPGAGAASYHPIENKVIFIHGLPVCTEKNPYQQWRRTGVIVNDNQPNVPILMDARDVTFPFTPGALRGGTHRHEWSRDGKWVGYTYNDAIMKKLEDSTGVKWNLRTIAVSNQHHRVVLRNNNPEESVAGTWFSAVVVRVVPDPKPGSDEISNAASDSWIGMPGYRKPDGTLQIARAFIGKVNNKDGKPVDELFVVDIPDSINVPGEYGPLEGTRTTFPMPPKGTVQRRLTHTADTRFPGCGGVVRSSPDGKYISYLAKDKNGIEQVFLMSPLGGEPLQVTEHPSNVQSGVRWSSDNRRIIYIWDNSIVITEISERPFTQRFKRLTAKTPGELSNLVWSNDEKTIAFNRPVPAEGKKDQKQQIFVIRL